MPKGGGGKKSFTYPDAKEVLGKAAGFDSPNDCWTPAEQRVALEDAWREAGESVLRDMNTDEAEAVRAYEAKMETCKSAENLAAVHQTAGVAARSLMEALCKVKCHKLGITLTSGFNSLADIIQKLSNHGAFPGYMEYVRAVKDIGNTLGHLSGPRQGAANPSAANCAVMCCKYTVEVLKQHEKHEFDRRPDYNRLKQAAKDRHSQRDAKCKREEQERLAAQAADLASKRLEVVEAEKALLQQKAEDEQRQAQVLAQRQAVLESERQAQEAALRAATAEAERQAAAARAAEAAAQAEEAKHAAAAAERGKLQDAARAEEAAEARLRAEAEAAQQKEVAAKAEAEAAEAKAKLQRETAALRKQEEAADVARALLEERRAAAAAANAAEANALAAAQEETRKRLEAEARMYGQPPPGYGMPPPPPMYGMPPPNMPPPPPPGYGGPGPQGYGMGPPPGMPPPPPPGYGMGPPPGMPPPPPPSR